MADGGQELGLGDRGLAGLGEGVLVALVLGADPGQAAQAIAQAGYGATGVLTLAAAGLEPFTAEAWGDAIVHAVKATGATVIGGSASSTLRDALPRAAALLDAPLASDIVQVKSANVLVFPDLTSANTSYKLMARLGDAESIGPILVGMGKPVHVLERGCEVRDIVNVAILAVVDVQYRESMHV